MEPQTPMTFKPFHDAPLLIKADQMALAAQMLLCRTDRNNWHHLMMLVERAQAFTARHLISLLILVGTSTCLAVWLMD